MPNIFTKQQNAAYCAWQCERSIVRHGLTRHGQNGVKHMRYPSAQFSDPTPPGPYSSPVCNFQRVHQAEINESIVDELRQPTTTTWRKINALVLEFMLVNPASRNEHNSMTTAYLYRLPLIRAHEAHFRYIRWQTDKYLASSPGGDTIVKGNFISSRQFL